MARTYEQQGPWTLLELLGTGGNAKVWRASRSSSESALAVKFINTAKVDREPYRRFVREIEFLRTHSDVPGVLPLIDSYLPDSPSMSDVPWLAMPIAAPMSESLDDAPLTTVVEAVGQIADTLYSLQNEFDIAHRDIKPHNVYKWDERWVIGDFGLISIPDAQSLTKDGKQIGPAHYTAYEMMVDALASDPHLADVYSLGKTLWVLATGQKYPPDGHQPAEQSAFAIGAFRPHSRVTSLDREVDLMTRIDPLGRPSKEQVARDLRNWLKLASEPPVIDLSLAQRRFREKLQPTIAKQDVEQRYRQQAHAAIRRLQELTSPLNQSLKELYQGAQIDLATDEFTSNFLRTRHSYPRAALLNWQRCTLVVPLDGPGGVTLRMSRSLELMDDGELILRLMVHVGRNRVSGVDFHWASDQHAAQVGTIEAEKLLEDGVTTLAIALSNGVDVFVENLPSLGES